HALSLNSYSKMYLSLNSYVEYPLLLYKNAPFNVVLPLCGKLACRQTEPVVQGLMCCLSFQIVDILLAILYILNLCVSEKMDIFALRTDFISIADT
uniref:hypothetical protein n=1 Tax=Prevotella pectinovora TaxID=1602169 RepID=UPI00307AE896